MSERKGTRCAVCVGCGKCFETKDDSSSSWTGDRCDVCVGCGKCLAAWGLSPDSADGESGPTNWADAFKVMDTGKGAPPPVSPGAPGAPAGENNESADATSGATPCVSDDEDECDASTGATPGVSAACKEFGFNDMSALNESLGINPPGVS